MGKIKYLNKIRELFQKSPLVTISSLKRILGREKGYIHVMLNNLVRKGEIFRVTRGKYSQHDDPTVAVYCFQPSYLGLQNALSIHNLWEQETNIIILTTQTVREGLRKCMGSRILLKRIPPALFFGVEYKQYGNFYVPVSDIEKTFLDLLYFRQLTGRQLISHFRKKLDRDKLNTYLSKYEQNFQKEVRKLLKIGRGK
jgi:predicted transcriptional regulator of viral defense system